MPTRSSHLACATSRRAILSRSASWLFILTSSLQTSSTFTRQSSAKRLKSSAHDSRVLPRPLKHISRPWSDKCSRRQFLISDGSQPCCKADKGAIHVSQVPEGGWTRSLPMGITHSTVSPHRSVDATGRALPMTVGEILAQAVEIARGLDALDDMSDEDEQRQTLNALMKAIDEEPLSPRRRFRQ